MIKFLSFILKIDVGNRDFQASCTQASPLF
jgi:hypothetical protein